MSNGDGDGDDARLQTQTQTQTNRSREPTSRFLLGILGTLFALLVICTVVLTKPYFIRVVRRLETARQQRVVVDRTIEKRRLARKPKLLECWIDCEGLGEIRLHDNYGTTWADLQPLSADLGYTPPPTYTIVAPVVAERFARSPIRLPGSESTSRCPWPVHPVQLPHRPHQRPWIPDSDGLVQLTLFVAMPTPSRPLYSPRSCPSPQHLAPTSTSLSPSRAHHDLPSQGILTSPYTHQGSFPGTNIQQELTLGLTTTLITDLRPSLPSAASDTQKHLGPS